MSAYERSGEKQHDSVLRLAQTSLLRTPQVRRSRRMVTSYPEPEIQTEGKSFLNCALLLFVANFCPHLLCYLSIPSAWYSTTDPESFASFLAKSDVILLSLPSTPATTHILNSTTLAHLKPSAVIVNVGRGNAIDTNALVAALDEGKLAGAALDVTEPEPLPDGHPLYGRRNVIITPHLSGLTETYYDRCVDTYRLQ